MDRVLRINLSEGTVGSEPLPEQWRLYGGRALTSRVVAAETDPTCDPLGPSNPLVWAPGLLSGTVVSSSNRISVGCKSPLTGGIKEANAGGETGLLMAQAGWRALVVIGAAAPGTWWLIIVDRDGARLEPAPDDILGVGTHLAARRLCERFGHNSAFAICGPAGEQRMNIAGICNTDREGRPSRLNARGGVGAVMGSKGIKAVVFLGDRRQAVPARDPAGWRQGSMAYHKLLQQHPATAERYPQYGTAGTLEKVNALGGLPTRNFSSGKFEGADLISGIHLRELILARGGDGMTTHSCMTGCAIRCSNVFADAQGKEVASSMEFETNGLLGSNLGIADLDWIARFTFLCNDLGVDTIETGGAIGVAMEAGLLPWGDAAGVERLLDADVRRGTPLGKIIGAGAGIAGQALGVRRVPVVKNQTISAYDPRAIKGNGVTYCTSPMGADHTAGNTIGASVDHLDRAGKVELSRQLQLATAILDATGYCAFARPVSDLDPTVFAQMFNARMGTDLTWEQLQAYALDLIRDEVAFNRAAGLGPATDRLPEWMRTEALAPHDARFDITDEELDRIWEPAPSPVGGGNSR